jgi:hypothetical protein
MELIKAILTAFAAYAVGRWQGMQADKLAKEKAAVERGKLNAEVDHLPPADRDKRFDRWVRK